MANARDIIADAATSALRAGTTVFGDRVYSEGDPDWDRRTYPIAVISILSCDIEIVGENGEGQPRLLRRRYRAVVEAQAKEIDNISRELGDMSTAVEAALIPSSFSVPIEDIFVQGDTGPLAIAEGEDGLIGVIGTHVVITCHTFEGRPDVLVDPSKPFTTIPTVSTGGIFDV